MGSKGSSRHQKRLSAPIVYPIKRKHGTFTIKPLPTRSRNEFNIPIGIIIREKLGYAKTLREVKKILKHGFIKVDGKIRKEYKFSVGPMDIIEIPQTKELFRVTPYSGKRKLTLHPINKKETTWKLLQVTGKKKIRGDKILLTYHDGRNYIWDEEKNKKIDIQDISPNSSVKFDLEKQKILEHYPFGEGSFAVILGGHNTGVSGKILSYEKRYGRFKSIVLLETEKGNIQTSSENIFIIGAKKGAIEIPTPAGATINEHSE